MDQSASSAYFIQKWSIKLVAWLLTAFIVNAPGFVLAQSSSSYINIQFGGDSFAPIYSAPQSGAGVIGSAGDSWNYMGNSQISNLGTGVSLNDVSGNPTSAVLMASVSNGSFGAFSTGTSGGAFLQGTPLADLFQGFLLLGFGVSNPAGSIIIKGLTPNHGYNVYVYSCPNGERASVLTLNGFPAGAVGPNNFGGSDAVSLSSPQNYVLLTANADSAGTLTLKATADGDGTEIDINGLQIQSLSAPVSNPLSPSQNTYDVQFIANTLGGQTPLQQLGAGIIGVPLDSWNYIDNNAFNNLGSGVTLHNTVGNTNGVTLTVTPTSGQLGSFSLGPTGSGEYLENSSVAALYAGYLVLGYGNPSPAGNMVITGLSANATYHLYLFGCPNSERSFSVEINGGASQNVGPNNIGGSDATLPTIPNNYLYATVNANSSGTITLQMAALAGAGEIDINGFQLQLVSVPTPTPTPIPIQVTSPPAPTQAPPPPPPPPQISTPTPAPPPAPPPVPRRRHRGSIPTPAPVPEQRLFPTPDLDDDSDGWNG